MLDTKTFLNDLLGQAKDLATKGGDVAASKMGVSTTGPDKDALVKGLGAGAIGGALLGLLLGTRSGRSIGGGVLKIGSIAALGTVAYKAYQSWQSKQSGAATPAAALPSPDTSVTDPLLLLRTMIAAAHSDGVVDAAEKTLITSELAKLGLEADAASMIEAELARPLDAKTLASHVANPQQAVEVYTLSASIIGGQNAAERAYLTDLATALNLAPDLAREIESQLAA
jgi:uncharacterized membrane protein YebE (DUF533 family)